ncbi:elongation factor 1-gamma-like [Anneissia japonica]|uniref:elongation factor 1-gamma-like n=1 Tax=Anneissia japonica TaxID=1529436 RepID=UPI001425670C|nr:elongation factor 1-gamma-like [Anneissia japonica]
MAAGTLYTYPDNFRAYKVQIAAKYSGADVKVVQDPPAFKLGETNKSAEFLKKFPLGKVPAFEGNDGTLLTESNAIAFYVANETLRGCSVQEQAAVQMFVNFADNEIMPSACTWVYPTLGIMQFNKQNTERAKGELKNVMCYLNEHLKTRTVLVGERVTLADISVACNLLMLYQQVFDPSFRQPYGNVNRWFMTIVNQPQVIDVLGNVKLCEKMSQFDGEFSESCQIEFLILNLNEMKLFEYMTTYYKFLKNVFTCSKFVLDEWKRMYSNNPVDVALPWFWENADFEGYSIWFCEYLYPEDLKMVFMASNLVSGALQRLDSMRKHAFASILILGENKNTKIQGVWFCRGQDLIFDARINSVVDLQIYVPEQNEKWVINISQME